MSVRTTIGMFYCPQKHTKTAKGKKIGRCPSHDPLPHPHDTGPDFRYFDTSTKKVQMKTTKSAPSSQQRQASHTKHFTCILNQKKKKSFCGSPTLPNSNLLNATQKVISFSAQIRRQPPRQAVRRGSCCRPAVEQGWQTLRRDLGPTRGCGHCP